MIKTWKTPLKLYCPRLFHARLVISLSLITLFMELLHDEKVLQSGRWRFHPYLLKDPNFISYFHSEFTYFYTINHTTEVSPSTLWETCKVFSRGLIIAYESKKKLESLEKQRVLELQLAEAEREYIPNPSNTKLNKTLAARPGLNSFLTQKARQNIWFVKQKLYEFANKPSKYLASLLKKRPDPQNISWVKDSSSQKQFDSKSINLIFKKFYTDFFFLQQFSPNLFSF